MIYIYLNKFLKPYFELYYREAKDQFINLPLINTLRVSAHNRVLDVSRRDKGGDDEEGKEENAKPMETVPQPPSFAFDYV